MVVDGCHSDSSVPQELVGVAARGAPQRIEDHPQPRLFYGVEINDLSQSRQIVWANINLLRCRSLLFGIFADRAFGMVVGAAVYGDLRLDLLSHIGKGGCSIGR